MFFIVGICFLALLSITLFMLWAHERIQNGKITPHARIEEYWDDDSEDRRKHERHVKGFDVEYSVEKKPQLKNGKTVNISKGGMKILLDEKLPKGSIIDLKIRVPEKNREIKVEAQIVWTKDEPQNDPSGKRFFHSGIKFMAIKEPSDIHFAEFLNSIEEQNSNS